MSNTNHPGSPPSGTVTFLFTDIVGSTEMWERHGDAFLPVLQAHNAILMEAITRYGGYLIKTEGDAYKVAFSDPVDAAKCAIVAQAALHRYPWPKDVGQLSVRMALHTGTPFMQAGDYFGPPVNRTARILSATHGGQILISEDTLGRVENKMDTGTGFQDQGYHRLKDLGEPARLFQLEHTKLELHNFPPPRTLSATDNNLPVQRTSFVGREKEIEQIAALLTRSDVPLLTLTGPGGIGKTRLSLQAAAERVELFPDGVWYVKLDTATDVDSAAFEVSRTLGIEIPQGSNVTNTVRSWLAERRCLLILDDCGHLTQADKLIRELLSGNASLRCIATSRGSLQVEEGIEIAVPEMALPQENASAEEVMAAEGGRLFVERSHEANPRFLLNDQRSKAISRLLHKIPGFPEVIEKAASVMKKAPPGELVDALGEEVVHTAKQVGHAAVGLIERVKESQEFAALLQTTGGVAAERKELAEAERICRHALSIYQKVGDRNGIATSLWQLGNVARKQHDHKRAVTLLSAALQAATECGSADVNEISIDLAYARRSLGVASAHAPVDLNQAVALALGSA